MRPRHLVPKAPVKWGHPCLPWAGSAGSLQRQHAVCLLDGPLGKRCALVPCSAVPLLARGALGQSARLVKHPAATQSLSQSLGGRRGLRPPPERTESQLEECVAVLKHAAELVKEDPRLAEPLAKVIGPTTELRWREATKAAYIPVDPTPQQLRHLFFTSAVPMIAFGFLDNSLMILFGNAFDQHIAVAFGLSTMFAAAVGNTVSDVAGIFSGNAVDTALEKYLGIQPPSLSASQLDLPIARRRQAAGQCLGITLGCFLGMLPLLFMDPEKERREREREEVFRSVFQEVREMFQVEKAVFAVPEPGKDAPSHFVFKAYDQNAEAEEIRAPIGKGVMGRVYATKEFLNVEQLQKTEYYDPDRHDDYFGSGTKVRNVLCMPVLGSNNNVIGVVELINKLDGKPFTQRDEDALSTICTHISLRLESGHDADFSSVVAVVRNNLRTAEMKGETSRISPASRKRLTQLFSAVLKSAAHNTGAEAAAFLVWDRKDDVLRTRATYNLPDFEMQPSQGALGWVARYGRGLSLEDVRKTSWYDPKLHDDFMASGLAVRSVLTVPIFNLSQQVIGVITVINRTRGGAFTQPDADLLNALASHFALTLQGEGSSLRAVISLLRRQQEATSEEAMLSPQVLQPGTFRQVYARAPLLPPVPAGQPRPAVRLFLTLGARDLPSPASKPGAVRLKVVDPYVRATLYSKPPDSCPLRHKVPKPRGDGAAPAEVVARGVTRPVKEEPSPVWDQVVGLRIAEPTESMVLHLEVLDRDFSGQAHRDAVIAQTWVSMRSLDRTDPETVQSLSLQPGSVQLSGLDQARLEVNVLVTPGAVLNTEDEASLAHAYRPSYTRAFLEHLGFVPRK